MQKILNLLESHEVADTEFELNCLSFLMIIIAIVCYPVLKTHVLGFTFGMAWPPFVSKNAKACSSSVWMAVFGTQVDQ